MSTATLDPMAAAVQDAESAGQIFGSLEVEAAFVILKKGERKQPWHEGDSLDERQTEVTFRLNPLDISGLTKMVERQILSNSREWSAIVWESLRNLGVKALPELRGKWAHEAMVKSGRNWTNRDGEPVEGTTLKFLALFNTEAEAVQAYQNQFGSQPRSGSSSNGALPANDAEKNTAMQFLPALVKGANGDLTKLAQILASMSPVNKYFTVDSPEVQALLQVS